ncbi:MAG: hypothetical protein CL693_07060 [Cellvibrionaceae bacterium]|nr:hypothetical protein [Cellvibrionaceae bacterium]|tara:strand:+ start:16135 stop:16974 length:840 start_codon:yes stop_codon:yes gene_type:complete
MANQLLDAIKDGLKVNKPLLWLDAEAYGAEVVRNGKPFPWAHPTEFVASYGQLQNLLKPGVAPVHLGNFLKSWLEANPTALSEMSGKKRVRFALKKLLGMEAPRAIMREIVSALCESVSQPLVLVLPSNGELINWANTKANGTNAQELTEIDIDSVSVYLADFLRAFAGLNVAGVLVQLPEGQAVNPELLDLYSPVINVSKHYHWALGVQVTSPSELNDSDEQLDLIISDKTGASCVELNASFWAGADVSTPESGFYYGKVAADLKPELVLERLQSLRA